MRTYLSLFYLDIYVHTMYCKHIGTPIQPNKGEKPMATQQRKTPQASKFIPLAQRILARYLRTKYAAFVATQSLTDAELVSGYLRHASEVRP
jgi:hypothetical protein